jgi:multidrug resistance efflux pump
MEKDKLPPIPTPASQRWREFRIQVLPFVVFLSVLSGIVYLWNAYVQPVGVIGSAETNMVNVTSLSDGLISELYVERFQTVTNGELIAVVVNTDPELIRAQIESAQADIKVLAARNEVDVQRTDQSYRQLRQDLFSLQVAQAISQVDWLQASNDWAREEVLFKQNIGQLANLQTAQAKRDAYAAAIQERSKQMDDLRQSLDQLGGGRKSENLDAFSEAIEKKGRELELMLKPSKLLAPIGGMVSLVHHVQNERVLRGMPIVSISDPETRRIIGYIRQPVLDVPTTNDFARISTRSQPRQSGRGQILHVGAQLEPINPALLAPDTKRMEVGLPIVVAVPNGIHLVPGEYLDLFIEPNRPTK